MTAPPTTRGSTTSAKARATCARCSAAREPTSPRWRACWGPSSSPPASPSPRRRASLPARRRRHAGRARGGAGRRAGASRGERREAARRRRDPLLRLRAQRRARLDAGHDGHRPESRTQRRLGAGPCGAHRQRALRLGLLSRLVQMFGNVVRGIPGAHFEAEIAAVKAAHGVELDTDLDAAALRELTARFLARYDFPTDPREQFDAGDPGGLRLVERRRAVAYRRIKRHPGRLGHGRQRAADGVRQPRGDLGLRRRVLARRGHGRARPERRLPGRRTGRGRRLRRAHASRPRRPRRLAARPAAAAGGDPAPLERHYGDMQDTEFTVEEGRLYMLQTRSAKRHRARRGALRRATPSTRGCSPVRRRSRTIDAGSLEALLHPTFDPAPRTRSSARGVAASPGAAKGAIVFTAEQAVAAAAAGAGVILVRPFTEADDVAGFHAAEGILTSEGGKASTRRSSRAGWAGPPSPAPRRSTSTCDAARGADRRARAACRATRSRSTARRRRHARRRAARDAAAGSVLRARA